MIKYIKHLIIILCLMTNVLGAQSYLYNSSQFGIKGSMLGGVVTAGTDDISTIFYNPAAIYKVANRIDISLAQPKINIFGFKQFWNQDEESELDTDVELKSSLISFKTKLKELDIAFIIISRSDWDDRFYALSESTNNSIQSVQNFEYEFGGSDDWYGAGSSFELRPNLYLGVSQFVSVASFDYRNEILVKTTDIDLNPGQPIQYFKSSLNSSYDNLGLITKVGLLYDTEKHDIGLTITTPTYLRLNKGGKFNLSLSNINSDETNIREIIDSELFPTIKTPWEFNLGYSLAFNDKRKLWVNASYHAKISDYTMAKIQSIDASLDWMNGSKSILNYGIAYSDQVNSFLEMSVGVRTNNFSYENNIAEDQTVRNIILDGNHVHYTLSSKFKYKRNTILFGFDWGILTNVPNRENFNRLTNIGVQEPNIQDLTKQTISILFTYGFIIDEFKN